MLVPNQKVTIRWGNRNKKKYTNLGYKFTKISDEFEVDLEDVLDCRTNCIKLRAICDYCGKEYIVSASDYWRHHNEFGDVCSKKCGAQKLKNVCESKYGVDNPMKVEAIKQKSQETCLEKYGVTNINLLPQTADKKRQTFLSKYGVDNPMKCPEIKQKAIDTNMKKYGVKNPTQAPCIKQKICDTLCSNDIVPTSRTQIEVFEMLHNKFENCVLNHPLDKCVLDIALFIDGYKIDVEYDGWYWHKNKVERDRRRDCFVSSQGYKILRIRTNREMPTEEQLMEAIDYLLSGHSFVAIELDI